MKFFMSVPWLRMLLEKPGMFLGLLVVGRTFAWAYRKMLGCPKLMSCPRGTSESALSLPSLPATKTNTLNIKGNIEK